MLKFDLREVAPILEHSEKSPEHKGIYGDMRFAKPGLWLVHDQGVYLMSNGKPSQEDTSKPEGENLRVAYAEGCEPNADSFDWYQRSRDEVGGDDFVEYIAAKDVRKAIDSGMRWMNVKVSSEAFEIGYSKTRGKK